ncbi:acyl-CoA dehydrogenase family protein [Chloroflexota bacterium]
MALYESDTQIAASSVKTRAKPSDGGWRLSGTKLFVTDAQVADYIITPALTDEGVSLFLVEAKSSGVDYTPLRTLAGDKQYEVNLKDVVVPPQNRLGEAGRGWDYIQRVLPKATIVKCAEMVGMAQQVLEMSVSYAKERKQFGHPIGSFQAIQHYCAGMATDVDSSKYITYQAASLLSEGLACSREVSIAKAWVGPACHRVSMLGAEVQGSIGLSMDHDFPLYYRRIKAAELLFGDAEFHKEMVAQEAGL